MKAWKLGSTPAYRPNARVVQWKGTVFLKRLFTQVRVLPRALLVLCALGNATQLSPGRCSVRVRPEPRSDNGSYSHGDGGASKTSARGFDSFTAREWGYRPTGRTRERHSRNVGSTPTISTAGNTGSSKPMLFLAKGRTYKRVYATFARSKSEFDSRSLHEVRACASGCGAALQAALPSSTLGRSTVCRRAWLRSPLGMGRHGVQFPAAAPCWCSPGEAGACTSRRSVRPTSPAL